MFEVIRGFSLLPLDRNSRRYRYRTWTSLTNAQLFERKRFMSEVASVRSGRTAATSFTQRSHLSRRPNKSIPEDMQDFNESLSKLVRDAHNVRSGNPFDNDAIAETDAKLVTLLNTVWRALKDKWRQRYWRGQAVQDIDDNEEVKSFQENIHHIISCLNLEKDDIGTMQLKTFEAVRRICRRLWNTFSETMSSFGKKAHESRDTMLTRLAYGTILERVSSWGEVVNLYWYEVPIGELSPTKMKEIGPIVRAMDEEGREIARHMFDAFRTYASMGVSADSNAFMGLSVFLEGRIDCYLTLAEKQEAWTGRGTTGKNAKLMCDFLEERCRKVEDWIGTELTDFWLFARWELVGEKDSAEVVEKFRSLVELFFKCTVDVRPTKVKASLLARAHLEAAKCGDELADRMTGLLLVLVEHQCGGLELLRNELLVQLKRDPDTVLKDSDYYDDDMSEASAVTRTSEPSDSMVTLKKLMEQMTILNAALRDATEAEFLTLTGVKQGEDDAEEDVIEKLEDETGQFYKYIEEEHRSARAHLTVLESLKVAGVQPTDKSGKLYSDAVSTISGSTRGRQRDDRSSVISGRTSKTMKDDRMSVTSSRSGRSVTSTAPVRRTVDGRHGIEEAIFAAYQQLMCAISVHILCEIRCRRKKETTKLGEELEKTKSMCMYRLTELRKTCVEKAMVDDVEIIDERIGRMKKDSTKDMVEGIFVTLEDMVRRRVANYERKHDIIEDRYDELEDELRKELDDRVTQMNTCRHIPELVLLEEEALIAITREGKRKGDFAAADDRIVARVERASRKQDYVDIKLAQQKLEEEKEAERKGRIERVKRSFEKRRKLLLQKQRNELRELEKSFSTNMEAIARERDGDFVRLLNVLRQSVITVLQRQTLFARQFLPASSDTSRMGDKLEKRVRKVLSHDYEKIVLGLKGAAPIPEDPKTEP